MLVKENLTPLKGKYSNEEYSKLWKKLHDSARDLDFLYEASKEATFNLRKLYDEIQHTERLNKALKVVYYDALTRKSKHESDRDDYFQCDAKLAEIKSKFVEESQQLSFACSKYIEYSQRLSFGREELFSQFLDDFGKLNDQVLKIGLEKNRLKEEIKEQKIQIQNLTNQSEKFQLSFENSKSKKQTIEEERNHYKKEAEWSQRQNTKLQEKNKRLEKEIVASTNEIRELKKVKNEEEKKLIELNITNQELVVSCAQSNEVIKNYCQQIKTLQDSSIQQEQKWLAEKEKLSRDLKAMEHKWISARESASRTIYNNQQLRHKLFEANRKVDKITKEKLTTVLKKHKTKKENVELTTKQIELIDEVLELKKDFFSDQARIKEGSKLNRKLEINNRILQQKIIKLKDSPHKIDPLLDGAQEYRKQILRKFGARKVTLSECNES